MDRGRPARRWPGVSSGRLATPGRGRDRFYRFSRRVGRRPARPAAGTAAPSIASVSAGNALSLFVFDLSLVQGSPRESRDYGKSNEHPHQHSESFPREHARAAPSRNATLRSRNQRTGLARRSDARRSSLALKENVSARGVLPDEERKKTTPSLLSFRVADESM